MLTFDYMLEVKRYRDGSTRSMYLSNRAEAVPAPLIETVSRFARLVSRPSFGCRSSRQGGTAVLYFLFLGDFWPTNEWPSFVQGI